MAAFATPPKAAFMQTSMPLLLIAALLLSGCSSYIPRVKNPSYSNTGTATTHQTPQQDTTYLPPPPANYPPTVSGSVRTTINSTQTEIHSEPAESSSEPSTTFNPTDTGANKPRTSTASVIAKPANGALASLVNQAQTQLSSGNYQAAIATSERGLRIDRRTPELYLVLAKSYLKLGQVDQAAEFANQGLRFSVSGSPDAAALEDIRQQALQ